MHRRTFKVTGAAGLSMLSPLSSCDRERRAAPISGTLLDHD